MSAQVGEVVTAHCSQCKENSDVEIVAVVGNEIVTVACKTCGTSQRHRPPMDRAERARAQGRRVVDVGSAGSEPSPRPRGRPSSRRVLSSTGREIVDDLPPRRPPPPTPPPASHMPAPAPVSAPANMVGVKSEDLVRRWDALTNGVMSRHGRPHRSNESYREGEIILHTVYGMGIVEQIGSDGLLTALFRRGYQTLPSVRKAEPEAAKA